MIDPGGGEIQDAKSEGTQTQTRDVVQVEEGVCDELDLSCIDNFDISDDCKSFSMYDFFSSG
jgi:hypothetical protein